VCRQWAFDIGATALEGSEMGMKCSLPAAAFTLAIGIASWFDMHEVKLCRFVFSIWIGRQFSCRAQDAKHYPCTNGVQNSLCRPEDRGVRKRGITQFSPPRHWVWENARTGCAHIPIIP
jgi:hypothetical protein